MEGLRNQAFASLSRIKFAPAPSEHELITLNSTADTAFHRIRLPLSDILIRYKNPTSLPILKLVKLCIKHPHVPKTCEPAPTVDASKGEILRLWQAFNLDPTPLPLIGQGIWGVNQFPPVSWDSKADAFHFMISSLNTYYLIWTYHPRSRTTNGVILVRTGAPGRDDFEAWFEALQAQVSAVGHPLCLFIASAMEALQRTFQVTLQCHGLISDIEARTGYSPWLPAHGAGFEPMGVGELFEASRNIGVVLVSLEDFARHVKLLRAAIDRAGGGGFVDLLGDDGVGMASAVHILREQMRDWGVRIDYLRERAKNQLSVVR